MRLSQFLSVILIFCAHINDNVFVASTGIPASERTTLTRGHWHRSKKGMACLFQTSDEKPKGAIFNIRVKVTGGGGQIYVGAHSQVLTKYLNTTKLAAGEELAQPIIMVMPFTSEIYVAVKPDTAETIFEIKCDAATDSGNNITQEYYMTDI